MTSSDKWGVALVIIGVTTFILVLFLAPSANAGVTLKEYGSAKSTDWLRNYISGVGEGIFWANNRMRNLGMPPLYCQPDKLVLTRDNYLDILERFIQENKALNKRPESPIELLLLEGLIETFPCKK